MLAMAAVGVYLAFLLAIRLARGTEGAPAFAATAFLLAAPMFYTQSMMAVLDMPAMVFTALALLLFYDGRYRACAVACTVLVVLKETALTTPLVLGAWLWFRDGRRKDALWFALPALALAGWLAVLWRSTGSIFGNAEFAQYNVGGALQPGHIFYAIGRRCYTLFVADGHWIGSIALWFGWRALRGRDWAIALWVAAAQVAVVTLFGGAVLELEGSTAHLSLLVVDPQVQRQGLGRALLECCEQRAREAGCAQLRLEVREGNRQAIAFYRQCGYAQTHERAGYYGAKESALCFSRALP